MQEKIIVKSFGCRLNATEAAKLEIVARAAGLENAVIFNTCAVTSEAERQAKQAVRRAARENPNAKIYVVGCAADRDTEGFAALPGVAAVIKNADKFNPKSYNQTTKTMSAENIIVSKYPSLSKGFLQIQTGCNHACTYCIVHTLRGRSKSWPYEAILAQAAALVAGGFSEIVLTGVNITEFDKGLAPLAQRLLADLTGIRRLRMSSLDPAADELPTLIDLMLADSRVMPHMHLSMQSGCDEILLKMARQHRAKDLEKLAEYAAGRISFGVDIICGFPGETDKLFDETLRTLEILRPIKIHAFPFSPRPGTPAATMQGQIPTEIARARVAKLHELECKFLSEFMNKKIGTISEILTEKNQFGRTENDIPVACPDAPADTIISARLTGIKDGAFTL